MIQPDGHHLAELNVGKLRALPGDPRVSEFVDNIDRINGLGKRMPGFVWMMEGDNGPGNTDAMIDGDPRYIPNLTVWDSVAALETFVWGTVHRTFFEKRSDWFEVLEAQHFVMWWVKVGHRPSLREALDRLEDLRINGASERAFGWADLPAATAWRAHTG